MVGGVLRHHYLRSDLLGHEKLCTWWRITQPGWNGVSLMEERSICWGFFNVKRAWSEFKIDEKKLQKAFYILYWHFNVKWALMHTDQVPKLWPFWTPMKLICWVRILKDRNTSSMILLSPLKPSRRHRPPSLNLGKAKVRWVKPFVPHDLGNCQAFMSHIDTLSLKWHEASMEWIFPHGPCAFSWEGGCHKNHHYWRCLTCVFFRWGREIRLIGNNYL